MSSKERERHNAGLYGRRQEFQARTVISLDTYEYATLAMPLAINRVWLLQRLVNRLAYRLPSFQRVVSRYRRDLYTIKE